MLRRTAFTIALVVISIGLTALRSAAADKPLVHSLFADHMVLQRDLAAPVWGWAEPGCEIRVTLAGKNATARADNSGRWQVELGPFSAGGPHTLRMEGPQTAGIRCVGKYPQITTWINGLKVCHFNGETCTLPG